MQKLPSLPIVEQRPVIASVFILALLAGCQSALPLRQEAKTAESAGKGAVEASKIDGKTERSYADAGLESLPELTIDPTAEWSSPERTIAAQPVVLEANFNREDPASPPENQNLQTTSPPPGSIRPLTLSDFEVRALANNPSVARAHSLVQAACGNWMQVGLPPNPTVGYEAQQIGSSGRAEQDGVFVSQEFVRGGKLQLNRQVAAHAWSRAKHELEVQQNRVVTDVRIAFYQMLIAERQEQLAADLLQVAREGAKVAEKLHRGKEVGKVDVVQAQLEAENVEIVAANARNRRIAAWAELTAVAGDPCMPPQPLAGDAEEEKPVVTWEESLEKLQCSSPEVSAAQAAVERANCALQRAVVEKTPNVTVEGLMNFRDNGIGGRPDAGLLVGVPLPLWDRNQGGVTQAYHEAAAAEQALEQLKLDLQKRLAPVYERYRNAMQQTARYRAKILPAARESLALTRQLYQAGEANYVTLLTAQRTYSQIHLNYLESLRELRSAEAEMEGFLLSGSLESR